MGLDVSNGAIIVKMIRVMLLMPVLLILGVWAGRRATRSGAAGAKGKMVIPWFAIGFLIVIAFNSLNLLPSDVLSIIEYVDTFLLTMAMAALGAETSFDKFKKAGAKPFVLAFSLYVWLIGGGYLLARYLAPLWL